MQLNFHLAVAVASSLVWGGGGEFKSQIMDSRTQAARLPWGGVAAGKAAAVTPETRPREDGVGEEEK